MKDKLIYFLVVSVVSVLCAIFCGIVYVVMTHLTLPPSDAAYGQNIFQTLTDPFVISIGGFGVLLAGLVSSPFCALFWWKRNLKACAIFSTSVVSLEIILISLIWWVKPALTGAPIALFLALVACKFVKVKFFEQCDAAIFGT